MEGRRERESKRVYGRESLSGLEREGEGVGESQCVRA